MLALLFRAIRIACQLLLFAACVAVLGAAGLVAYHWQEISRYPDAVAMIGWFATFLVMLAIYGSLYFVRLAFAGFALGTGYRISRRRN